MDKSRTDSDRSILDLSERRKKGMMDVKGVDALRDLKRQKNPRLVREEEIRELFLRVFGPGIKFLPGDFKEKEGKGDAIKISKRKNFAC